MTETTQRTPVSAERLRSRTPVKELIYVQLSESEGGLALNIGENGVGIRVSAALRSNVFPLIRLRLPDAENWIETSGRLAWSNKDTRTAGVEFINLSELSAEQIKRWMASQISGGKQLAPSSVRPNGGPRYGRARAKAGVTGSAPATFDRSRHQAPATAVQTSEGAPSRNGGGPARYMTRDGYATNYSPYIPVSAGKPRRWWMLAAIVGLVAAASFLAGIALGPPGRSVPLRGAGAGVADPAPSATPSANTAPPAGSSHPSASANRSATNEPPVLSAPNALDGTVPGDREGDAAAPDVPASTPSVKNSNHSVRVGSGEQTREQLAAKEPQAQPTVGSAAVASEPSDDSTNVQRNNSTASPGGDRVKSGELNAENAPTVSAARTESPQSSTVPGLGTNAPQSEIPSGTVTYSSRFLSIKLTPELSAQPSKLTGSLQIGQLFSTTQPLYPVDAARQEIQGVVKVRATVGPDGSVQGAQVVSGPAELDAAAIKAVLGWKYGPTLLGNQPVGAVHEVTLTFKLSNASVVDQH